MLVILNDKTLSEQIKYMVDLITDQENAKPSKLYGILYEEVLGRPEYKRRYELKSKKDSFLSLLSDNEKNKCVSILTESFDYIEIPEKFKLKEHKEKFEYIDLYETIRRKLLAKDQFALVYDELNSINRKIMNTVDPEEIIKIKSNTNIQSLYDDLLSKIIVQGDEDGRGLIFCLDYRKGISENVANFNMHKEIIDSYDDMEYRDITRLHNIAWGKFSGSMPDIIEAVGKFEDVFHHHSGYKVTFSKNIKHGDILMWLIFNKKYTNPLLRTITIDDIYQNGESGYPIERDWEFVRDLYISEEI